MHPVTGVRNEQGDSLPVDLFSQPAGGAVGVPANELGELFEGCRQYLLVIAEQELGASRRQRWKDRFQWLLALALAALMVEPLIAESARRSDTTETTA